MVARRTGEGNRETPLCPVRNGGLSVPVAACDHIDPRLDQAAWRAPLAEPAPAGLRGGGRGLHSLCDARSEEHTSELQSLMRISYAVFCLKKKQRNLTTTISSNTE